MCLVRALRLAYTIGLHIHILRAIVAHHTYLLIIFFSPFFVPVFIDTVRDVLKRV